MRSRERLAETLRSINIKVFMEQSLTPPPYPTIRWSEYFKDLSRLVLDERPDPIVQAELYGIKSLSPHYEELIREAREYLGAPF